MGRSTRGSRGNELRQARHTRASALWVGTAVAVVLLLLLVIFIAQNGQRVTLHFLGANGSVSLAVGLLAAAVVGAAIVLLIGAARVAQLRLAARRHTRGHPGSTPSADPSAATATGEPVTGDAPVPDAPAR